MRSGFGVARCRPRLARNRYCRRSGPHAQWVSASRVAALGWRNIGTAAEAGRMRSGFGVARWCPRLARNRYCRRSGAHAQWFRGGSLVPSAGQKSVLQAKRGAGAVVSASRVAALGWRNIGTAAEAGRMRSGFRRGSLVPSDGQKSVLQPKRAACAVVSGWLVGALGWPEIGTAGEAGRRRSGFGVARCRPQLAKHRYCSRSGPHAQWFRRRALPPSAGETSVLQPKRAACAVGFGVARCRPRLARNRYCRRSGAHAQWFRGGSLVPSAGQKSVLQAKRGAGAVVSAWLVGALSWRNIGTAAEAGRRRSGFGVARWCPRLARYRYCSRSGPHAQWFRRRALPPSAGETSVLQPRRAACAVVSAWLVGALGWPKFGTAAVRRSHARWVSPAPCCPPVSTRQFCSRHCPRRHTENTAASRRAPAQCRSPCSPLLRRVWVTGPRFLPGAAGAGARPCGGGREERRGWRAPERRWADGSRRGWLARGC
ncbi:uncharacterized protein [Struthio camelus]